MKRILSRGLYQFVFLDGIEQSENGSSCCLDGSDMSLETKIDDDSRPKTCYCVQSIYGVSFDFVRVPMAKNIQVVYRLVSISYLHHLRQ